VTLRTHSLPDAEVKESPGAEFFVAAREKFNVSRAVWANMLRVSPRTVEKWEQGGQVSPLAATFVELVSRYPDTIDRLQTSAEAGGESRRNLLPASSSGGCSCRTDNFSKRTDTHMELNQLETFLAVAEERSFSRAAVRLHQDAARREPGDPQAGSFGGRDAV
jgi:putative transcriptional regulator